MNAGHKRPSTRYHASDRKFIAWARTATVVQLRAKTAALMRQKDFPDWKRVVLVRAIVRALDLEEKE